MSENIGFRIRLRVHIAKAFTTDETCLNVTIGNKIVEIKSQMRDEPLSNAKWITFIAREFATENEAKNFGEELKSMVQLAALASRIGVNVGEDKPTGWINEKFARSVGMIQDHERIKPNVHGLMVLPDDDNTRIAIVQATGSVTANPEQFTSALNELGESKNITYDQKGTRLLNFALMTSEPLAQMVLCISAVEDLGQNEKWNGAQSKLIEKLAAVASESTETSEVERSEVVDAIRKGLFRVSLRQGVMRLLERLELNDLRGEWDRLYAIRSGIFHGTVDYPDAEKNQAASDTIKMCGKIIFASIKKHGVVIPSIAAIHF